MEKEKRKLIDFERMCLDFQLPYKIDKRRWICVRCPFCGDSSSHLGYNMEKGYFTCYRCGWHPAEETIGSILRLDLKNARSLISKYRAREIVGVVYQDDETDVIKRSDVKWPDGLCGIGEPHKKYLEKRGFNSSELESSWKIKATSYWGAYAFRIVAPISFEGEIVSWQSRSISDDSEHPYVPCPSGWETLHYKHLLYGYDEAKWKTCVVVEGITGVWRLGPGAVATFGVRYTRSQLLLISNKFESVVILMDGDEPGQAAADKMYFELSSLGKNTKILEPIGCDSGDMPDEIAREVMKKVRDQ
jgi:hypothetical protein